MEREANYIAVGIFVLLMLVMGVLFVYWYSDSRDHLDYQRYEIYFDGTVSGLSEGGPVRYLGVNVGRVQRIRIDPRAASAPRGGAAAAARGGGGGGRGAALPRGAGGARGAGGGAGGRRW